MLSASSATGQLVFLPALAALTESHGWRFALTFVCCALALALVVVALLMRNRPADIGLTPYGSKEAAPAPAARQSLGQMLASPLKILREVSGSRAFWVLFATFFICGASTNGLIQTHFISLCGDYGIVPVAAAGVLATMGIFDFFGTIGSGWLSDRFDNRKLLFWYYGLRGLSLIYLPHSNFSMTGLSVFALFYGLDWIATVPPTVKLIADRFGPERANVVFGWVFAGHQLGAASAAFGGGWSRTVLYSYLPAYFTAGALCIGAALIIMTLARPGQASATPRPAAA
jgi:predicted MFS family arabinose efflux permease